MHKIIDFLKKEFLFGYTLFDRLFLAGMLVMQLVVYAIVPDSPLGIIAGISGVISVVLCAKAKISFYFIGFVQTITYLVLAWKNRFYGEVMENIFYLITMVYGIFVWKSHYNSDSDGGQSVDTKKISATQWVILGVAMAAATAVMGFVLNRIGSAQAYTDACTNVLAVFAQLLMVRRYREQWILWLLIDLLCIKMWFVAGNWSMVAMYVAWTANCIYGWKNWSVSSKPYSKVRADMGCKESL